MAEWVICLQENNIVNSIRDTVYEEVGTIFYNISQREEDPISIFAGVLAGLTLSIRRILEDLPENDRKQWVNIITEKIAHRPPISKNLH